MKKPHIPEYFIGIVCLLLVVSALVTGFFFLNKQDTRKTKVAYERMRVRELEDSLEQVVALREQQKLEWAKQKEERDKKRDENEKKQQQYQADKERREAEKRPIDPSLIRLHPFDPNQADSSELVHLGFTPRMASNMLKYRAANGRYRKKEDLLKIYDMTDSLYASLEPYIEIAALSNEQQKPLYTSLKRDTILELNKADTAQLQLLRGIAGYTARQIVRYREQLGGFCSVEQLREVPNIRSVDSIMPHFIVDSALITPLYVNRLSAEVMAKHPYIRYEQAKALRDWRHRKGTVRDWEDVKKIKINGAAAFSEGDLLRLKSYLNFEK